MKSIKKILIGACFAIVIAAASFFAVKALNTVVRYTSEVYQERIELQYYAAKDELVSAIDVYIASVAPASTMNGLAFVKECDKYNVDVRFALAQAQLESHFATTGLGGKMNSAFNVGAFDGQGTAHMARYKHPDFSIEPFLELITTDYLVNGKTECDMMKKYVNTAGKRYASFEGYEDRLFEIYSTIVTDTNITDVYNNYKKHRILAER